MSVKRKADSILDNDKFSAKDAAEYMRKKKREDQLKEEKEFALNSILRTITKEICHYRQCYTTTFEEYDNEIIQYIIDQLSQRHYKVELPKFMSIYKITWSDEEYQNIESSIDKDIDRISSIIWKKIKLSVNNQEHKIVQYFKICAFRNLTIFDSIREELHELGYICNVTEVEDSNSRTSIECGYTCSKRIVKFTISIPSE